MEEKISKIYDFQLDPDHIQDRLTDLKDRSRHNNIRIDSVKDLKNETWEKSGKEVLV